MRKRRSRKASFDVCPKSIVSYQLHWELASMSLPAGPVPGSGSRSISLNTRDSLSIIPRGTSKEESFICKQRAKWSCERSNSLLLKTQRERNGKWANLEVDCTSYPKVQDILRVRWVSELGRRHFLLLRMSVSAPMGDVFRIGKVGYITALKLCKSHFIWVSERGRKGTVSHQKIPGGPRGSGQVLK